MWRREKGTVVRRAVELPAQASAPFAIRAGLHVPAVPTEWPPHAHLQHELVWVRGGTLTSRVADRIFTVCEGHGLWMPAGTVHAGRATAGAEFHDAPLRRLEKNPVWKTIPAVKEGRAHAFPARVWGAGGPRSCEQAIDAYVDVLDKK